MIQVYLFSTLTTLQFRKIIEKELWEGRAKEHLGAAKGATCESDRSDIGHMPIFVVSDCESRLFDIRVARDRAL